MKKTTVLIRGKEYEFDIHGYLDPPDQWDENFAEGLAVKIGIYDGLTEEHWKFVRYLRKKFIEEDKRMRYYDLAAVIGSVIMITIMAFIMCITLLALFGLL